MSKFLPPSPSLGPCVWMSAPGDPPCAAIITEVGLLTVTVAVFPPDARTPVTYTGVRHVSDPEIERNPGRDGGCWDFTASDKLLRSLPNLPKDAKK